MKNDTHHDNDDFDPWSPLGLATAVILNRIRNAQTLRDLQTDSPENGKDNDTPDNNQTGGKNEQDQHRLIERRIR
jgi:hypothetical protein